VRATSLGHAGILVQTRQAAIVCDPWFVPAFFGSWFPFPRNDRLDPWILDAIERPDYLYISHQHGDHLDLAWLSGHVDKSTPVLLPDFPTRELERDLRGLGFTEFIRTRDAEELDLGDGLRVAIHVEGSVSDGPGGDSAIVIADGESVLVDQNDCRTGDVAALAAHGPVDLHWLQYSGAIWYPMVYEESDDRLRSLARSKVESQFARAMRYVDAVDARHVVPSAGPPAFLDDDLRRFNHVTGDEISIFPDQTEFMRRLQTAGRHTAILNVPGTTIEVGRSGITVTHPEGVDVDEPFRDKARYLDRYRADWDAWLSAERASWTVRGVDLVAELNAWWGPLLALSPTLRRAIDGNCTIETEGATILVDFAAGQVRTHDGEPYRYRFRIARPFLERVVLDRAVDWSNSLFLSCRFSAWRDGEFNEHLYNFLKSLSPERIRRAEDEAIRRTTPDATVSDEVVIGDYVVQRFCPHRKADLSEFGVIDDDQLVCTLHGWRFRLSDGACLNADDRRLAVRRRDA